MIDACQGLNTADDVYNMLMDNFKRHYMSNKAPFPMFTHAAWFMNQPHRLDGEYNRQFPVCWYIFD